MEKQKIFITTAIDYVNSKPHIGHAYEKIGADILARYWRNHEADVYLLTGTDEHGLKIAQTAEKENKSPHELADEISTKYKAAWSALNISYDNFIRTTDPNHEKFVQDFLQKIFDNGEIYKDKYHGIYCIGCEEYKTDEDLLEGQVCPLHKTKCQLVEEEIYFFNLSKYKEKILSAIESGTLIIQPEKRKNEIIQFLKKEPLKDLAISRSRVEWGITLPWDKEQTVYVWVDALLNYISGSHGLWPPHLQLIGKDIFRFHAIIWPALLMAAGYELPEKIFIHGFLTVNGQKISKTIGNVIDPVELAQFYGTDALRYFLFREIPFGEDGNFSIERFKKRYNSDLANDLGNLLQRVLVMKDKYKIDWEYKISQPKILEINQAMEKLDFSGALNLIWQKISKENQKIEQKKPWDLYKTDKNELKKVITELLFSLSEISFLIEPFMPETSRKMVEQLQSLKPKPLFLKKE